MDGYHVALFVHLLSLVAASAAASLVHLAHARATRAGTIGEALQWQGFGGRVARVLPVSVLTLLATGSYMIASTGAWSWSAGWVQAGITGAVLLFLCGGLLGARQGRAGAEMARLAATHGPNHPAPAGDPLVAALLWVNPGIALAVTFLMATKPALPISASVLALGIVAGLAIGRVLGHSAEPAGKIALG